MEITLRSRGKATRRADHNELSSLACSLHYDVASTPRIFIAVYGLDN